ncbi:putative apolipoprotein(a)-like protein 2 [Mercenaria mercenaria]|uniref:putative apolipoprotein(a)-like protein 2 n=1 Tax=Mercenaria mercenaria TaxID=6596 RepID=UPI00234F2BE8|nr:putative apolipoprotein(a)-like protein 2 [Mercenaria mercenaria]
MGIRKFIGNETMAFTVLCILAVFAGLTPVNTLNGTTDHTTSTQSVTTQTQDSDDFDCFQTTSSAYNGTTNHTISGHTCQRWDVTTPNDHSFTVSTAFPEGSSTTAENYCRDPDGTGTPWCYSLKNGIRWEECGITKCGGRSKYK